MSVEVVVGSNWGDEGKGKIVDWLAQEADVVVRFQGGNNAGHVVVTDQGRFTLSLIPSGILNPKVINILGPGMVVDIEALATEISNLERKGIDCSNIRLSDRATICFPFERNEDVWEEERLASAAYGSTRKGIAPAYADRYYKKAIQVGDLLYPDALRENLLRIVPWKNLSLGGLYGKTLSVDECMDWAQRFGEKVKPYISNTSVLLRQAHERGDKILLEGQLGAMRDVIFGIYPFTTSSHTIAGYAPVGSGMLGIQTDRVFGVIKAFSTCVGAGPFVTEMDELSADRLRKSANEFGSVTGRPRRIGHFDGVASKYGSRVQGTTDLVLTKLDSLSGINPLLVCTHYSCDGKILDEFPINAQLDRCKPVYKEMPGWNEDISSVRTFDDLPSAAKAYVAEIERVVEHSIDYISVGPERLATIRRSKTRHR